MCETRIPTSPKYRIALVPARVLRSGSYVADRLEDSGQRLDRECSPDRPVTGHKQESSRELADLAEVASSGQRAGHHHQGGERQHRPESNSQSRRTHPEPQAETADIPDKKPAPRLNRPHSISRNTAPLTRELCNALVVAAQARVNMTSGCYIYERGRET